MNINKFILLIITILPFGANAFQKTKQVAIQTDKTVYVSGETIRFKCTRTQSETNDKPVLYVDLCGEGYMIENCLYQSTNSHWQGEIAIPDSVQTGVYLLRCYYGNQHGELSIDALLLPVVNRFGNNEVNNQRKNNSNAQAFNPFSIDTSHTGNLLKLQSTSRHFTPNSPVKINIESPNLNWHGGLAMSVFKIDTNLMTSANKSNIENFFTPHPDINIYNNLSLSGRITDKQSNKPLSRQMVLLSIPDSVANITYAYSDENGVFSFQIKDQHNDQNIIIQSIDKKNEFNISLFPMFLLPPQKIPFFVSEGFMNSEETKLAVLRTTMHKAYGDKKTVKHAPRNQITPFYGLTDRRIYPEIYIDLNDFNEIAWEILPTIKYRMSRDSTYLRVWDPDKKTFYNQPSILVDGVPVFDPATLNVLNSKAIKWVEIQAQTRCYGDILIDGLVAIQTYKGDFSEIELPKNAIKSRIRSYSLPYETSTESKPFFRDVLHWNPYLLPTHETTAIQFETSAEKGKYLAVVSGFDDKGNSHKAFFTFTIH
ncbi:MAG: hypothetical protein JW735_10555 [Prolixibacteraceae bacterium]|nr:hypothetical protein [Prolixibacteraceae bacterium]